MRALLLVSVVAFAVPDRPDPTPKQTARPLHEDIVGEWLVVKHVTGAKDSMRKNLMWVFTKGAMQHVYDENGAKRATATFPYTLDATKSPAVLVFPASKFAGIVRIEGDLMTICLHGSPDNQPPREFASPEGTRITLLQLTRVKK